MSAPVASKKQTLLYYLSRGVAMLHLDARRAGVVVPPQFVGDPHLRLNLSYRYAIPDLEIDDERGVQATLSFGGSPFQCRMPWPSIFGITSHASGDGQVWPEDLPTEVQQTLARDDRTGPDPAPAPQRELHARPALVPIDGSAPPRDGSAPPRDGSAPPRDGSAGPRRTFESAGSSERERMGDSEGEPSAEPRRVKKGEPPEGAPPRHLRLVR
jgi:stringent starvation protein B